MCLLSTTQSLPALQNKCWAKQPAGWVREPGQPGITSGLLTALTVQDFSLAAPGSAGAAPPPPSPTSPLSTIAPDSRPTSIGMLLTRLQAPLFGNATWREPPPGYQEGQCWVMLNRNANGTTVQDIAVGLEPVFGDCLWSEPGTLGRLGTHSSKAAAQPRAALSQRVTGQMQG